MGYNEDSQKQIEDEGEKKYKPMDQDDIDKYYNEETGTDSSGYGESYDNGSTDSEDEGYF